MELDKSTLLSVKGGAIKGLAYIITISIGSLVSLIAGIIDGYMNPLKCRRWFMMKLGDDYLLTIKGGTITSTMLNAVSRLITTILELGRTIGSSIYRYRKKDYCKS